MTAKNIGYIRQHMGTIVDSTAKIISMLGVILGQDGERCQRTGEREGRKAKEKVACTGSTG